MPLSKNSQNKFSKLNLQDLVDTFAIQKTGNLNFPELTYHFETAKLAKINEIIANAKDKIDYWNEQELVMKHLSFILDLANLQGTDYNTFAERQIQAKVGNIELGGITDLLVARGIYEPRNPYFFIQEFKKAKNQSGDPLAQLIGEMLVAQQLNNDNEIYGVYIVGKFWTFVAMNNREFTEQSELSSVNFEDLRIILYRLQWIKHFIESKLNI